MTDELNMIMLRAERDYQGILDILCTGDIPGCLVAKLDRLGRLLDALYVYRERHEVTQ